MLGRGPGCVGDHSRRMVGLTCTANACSGCARSRASQTRTLPSAAPASTGGRSRWGCVARGTAAPGCIQGAREAAFSLPAYLA